MRIRASRLGTGAFRVLLVLAPLLAIPALIIQLHHSGTFAYDFHGWYWPAGVRVRDGLSPYSLPMLKALHYPAVGALVFVPFSLLPRAVGDWTFTALAIACVPASLYVLGVRDWRAYAVVLLWQPVVYGWETANITLFLVLGIAVLWRWRDHAVRAGVLLALLVSVKLFLLPLCVWLISTRRVRALAWATGVTVLLNTIAWLILGLGQLPTYARILHAFTERAQWWGYSSVTVLLHAGSGPAIAYGLSLSAAGAVALMAFRAGRRTDDPGALVLCLAASLLASPIVEVHYLALLIIPVCLNRPRLSPLWAVPLLLWIAPVDHPADWQRLAVLCIAVTVLIIGRTRAQASRWNDALRPTFV